MLFHDVFVPFPYVKPDVPSSDQGWLVNNVKGVLEKFLNEDTKVIIELGSWLGTSTRFMLDCAPNAIVYAVDHWRGSYGHRIDLECSKMLPHLLDTFIVNCWDYQDRIWIVKTCTVLGLHALMEENVRPDLIYIDAGHEFNSVYLDILYSLRFFPNAQLVGDDYAPGCELEMAVKELATEFNKTACFNAPAWWYENE